jgi:hypothetical protein
MQHNLKVSISKTAAYRPPILDSLLTIRTEVSAPTGGLLLQD